ncbi:MAG: helix-turn-helix transcriptional regulator [Desulfobaccales bacterium]
MTLMDHYTQDPQFARLLAQEELILEVTETLCALLEKEGVSRTELARRLGKTKGFVSQLLGGGRNLTLRTLADVLSVLGYRLQLKPEKLGGEAVDNKGQKILTCHAWRQATEAPRASWEKISWPDNYFTFHELAI